jgi:hypothetical protein
MCATIHPVNLGGTFNTINGNMQVGHSGSSYAWTMRHLQRIATYGLDAYIAEFTNAVAQPPV